MVGIVNNLLLNLVEREKGVEGRQEVLAEVGMEGREFRSELIYGEEDFVKLLMAALRVLGVDGETGQRVFARFCGEVLVDRFPTFWRTAKDAKAFLLKVPKIHRDMPASTGGVLLNKLEASLGEGNSVVLRYDSPNRLCVFLKSMVEFALDHYHEEAEIIETRCTQSGADHCEVVVRFPQAGRQA